MKTSNNIVIVLLIAVSLFSGYLYFKVKALDQKISTLTAAPALAANNQPPQAPQVSNPPPVTDADHIVGSKNAKLLLVEYSDFECPFCKRFHPTMQQIIKDYGDKVAWVYRHYPLPFHANAQKEAEASECANELGGNQAFWKFTDTIYERTTSNGTGIALDQLVPMATELGLNGNSFKTCLDSGKFTQHVKSDLDGGSKAGVQGTPGTLILSKGKEPVFINGAQPIEQVKQIIDAALK